MKGVILLLVTSFVFSLAFSPKHRFSRRANVGFNSSLKNPDFAPHEHHFLQKLDHFHLENDQKWIQRYWTYPTYYKKGGPAFLFINGEWSVKINWTIGYAEHWVSYAKDLNAYCFSLEHRFYGESWPAKENMGYLSTQQALADIANFIQGVTEEFKLPKDINWIVFGCSYAGMLATWARLKYPHLIHGAVASSAPLLAKVDFGEYYQVVEQSLKAHNPKCVENIKLATTEINRMLNHSDGRQNIANAFHFCSDRPKDITESVENLFSDLAAILSEAVQYNDTSEISIPIVCDIMMNHNGSKIQAFAELRKLYMRLDIDNEDDSKESKTWDYQICSEFGYFQSSSQTTGLFAGDHFPAKSLLKEKCEQFFGPHFSIENLHERIHHTNMIYGGLDINVGNVIFVHGSLDPWHVLGLHTRKNESLYKTVFIKGASHCADVLPPADNDIEALKNARKEILDTLKGWLRKKST
ncbi:putative serine protease K12H4.7 [Planococcus citri]|uniref:putative serine protease K12H4.7 n=1 Tax=Planococcus citri TaxID=170843 RepID=UPI0031F94669